MSQPAEAIPAPFSPSLGPDSLLHKIDKTADTIKSYELGRFFETCFFDALERGRTYRDKNGKPFTYIETGDIHAMWLRDSYHQVHPYIPFAGEDANLNQFVRGAINQQTEFVLRDPYANAHVLDEKAKIPHRFDRTEMKPGVFERKWEPDSLAAVLELSYEYWKATGDISFMDGRWQEAVQLIYRTFRIEQLTEGPSRYKFRRPGITAILLGTERIHNAPANPVGLVRSTHRPSDDTAKFPFNIPVNFFVADALRKLSEMELALGNDGFADKSSQLAGEITSAIDEFAVVKHPKFGEIYAYETDGFGNYLLMDDATPPSFISLPPDNQRLTNTRAFVLSEDNPYYVKSGRIEGNGSPHTRKNMLWPISIIMRAASSTNEVEILNCLDMLSVMQRNGAIPESFSVHDFKKITRREFGMGRSAYASLILRLREEKPHLLMFIPPQI